MVLEVIVTLYQNLIRGTQIWVLKWVLKPKECILEEFLQEVNLQWLENEVQN